MLDETTCPVCGRDLMEMKASPIDGRSLSTTGIWAVAHYLAHLVQQKVQVEYVAIDPERVHWEADREGVRYVRVDNIPPPTA